jgi:hypothetical protein
MSGFPPIASRYVDPEGAGAPANVIDGVYENGDPFSIDITLQELDPLTDPPTPIAIVLTEVSSKINVAGITIVKKSNDTINISGSPSSIFIDSYYQFIMPDKSLKILPVDTKETYLSIVKWSPPSVKQIYDVPYEITLKYVSTLTGNVTETLTILQDIYWSYPPAVAGFKALLAKGTI